MTYPLTESVDFILHSPLSLLLFYFISAPAQEVSGYVSIKTALVLAQF